MKENVFYLYIQMSSSVVSRKSFEIFLYKHKLNEKSLIDILDKISPKTLDGLMKDLNCESVAKETIYVFSDGNVKNNGKTNAKGGYSIYFPDNEFNQFNKTRLVTTDPTNNKVELTGIKTIVKTINENINIFNKKEVVVCTDSQYSIKCVTLWYKSWLKNNWKNAKGEPVKNKELIESILNFMEKIAEGGCHVKFKHVFGHTKEPKDKTSMEWFLWNGNNIVDTNINKLLEKAEELKLN
jgi:ribonuclease HI